MIGPHLGSKARVAFVAFFILSNIALLVVRKRANEIFNWFFQSKVRVNGLLIMTSVVVTLGGVEYLAKGLTKVGILKFDLPMQTMVPEGTEDFRLAHITADLFREADPVLFWRPIDALPYTRQRFKGPVVERPKPTGVRRIICYGDSNTDGPRSATWPEHLQEILDEKGSPARDFEVLNAGVAGYSSFQGFLRFRSHVERFEPDVVLVSFGWNDLAPALGAPDRKFAPPPRWRIALQRLLLHYRAYLTARHHLRDPRMQQTEEGPRVNLDDYLENMRSFARVAHEHGVEIVFLTRPHRVPPHIIGDQSKGWRSRVESYNEALREVGQGEGWRVVDVNEWFASRDPGLFVDQCHFSDDGRRAMATLIFEQVPDLLDP